MGVESLGFRESLVSCQGLSCLLRLLLARNISLRMQLQLKLLKLLLLRLNPIQLFSFVHQLKLSSVKGQVLTKRSFELNNLQILTHLEVGGE